MRSLDSILFTTLLSTTVLPAGAQTFSPSITWSTYFGGVGADDLGASTANAFSNVCFDQAGNLYIGGHTNSTSGMTTAGSHQPTNGGGTDAFLAKFDPLGQLLWCTYYGGAGTDYMTSVIANGSRKALNRRCGCSRTRLIP